MSKSLTKFSLPLAVAALAWGSVGNAHASTIELDFTDLDSFATSETNPMGDQSWTGSKDGLSVTVTAGPSSSNLWWDGQDGFGVDTDTWFNSGKNYEDDEVEGSESLTVTFSQAVDIVSMNLTDLFNEAGCSFCSSYLEKGYYQIDGGAKVAFYADPGEVLGSGSNGEKTVAINSTATTIVLTAPGSFGSGGSEFSLSGFMVSVASAAVPELSAAGAGSAVALFLGFGLIIAGRRRGSGIRLAAG